jgi:non-homologous end joining protein Ku
MEVIEEKVESGGKEIEEKPKAKKPSTKVIDLVAVLQESLKGQAEAERKKARRRRRNTTQEKQPDSGHKV